MRTTELLTTKRIDVIVPVLSPTRSGNSVSASRYRQHFEALGYDVRVADDFREPSANLLVALNAFRCSQRIKAWHEQTRNSGGKVVIVATGTDVYRFLQTEPETVLAALRCADRIVGLNDLISEALPAEFESKLVVIRNGAPPIRRQMDDTSIFGEMADDRFHVVVIGHLRDVKDPLRAAVAARNLPESSRICVHHFGGAHNDQWERKAMEESRCNARFYLHGEVDQADMIRVYAAANVMVVSSELEGGANVTCEAIMAGVPILATRIPGNVGLLGEDYAGYFSFGNTAELQSLLLNCEGSPDFTNRLRDQVIALQPGASLQRERSRWADLLIGLEL